MTNAPARLHDTVIEWLTQAPWKDARHLDTLAWMVVGLLLSGTIHISCWIHYVRSRAQQAQSVERRFRRWLGNERIDVTGLFGTLVTTLLANCDHKRLWVVLDTSVLWNRFCVIQVALVFRGRALPLAWQVVDKRSASVCFREYRPVLEQVAAWLSGWEVVLLADRGFRHLQLVRWLKRQPHWHGRIRMKANVPIYRWTGKHYKPMRCRVRAGEVAFWHRVYLWNVFEEAGIAIGWEKGAKEPWMIWCDDWADAEVLADYGRRFTIEEGFLDYKSNGFGWEDSKLRDTSALQRLCFVMAIATWILICQGSEVVDAGLRRKVDPHWRRGLSYARIGWNWIHHALSRGETLIQQLFLPTLDDPAPVPTAKDRTRWMDPLPQRLHFCIHNSYNLLI
ncbi:MAG TPA: hypothetical protein ENJ91_10970 [Rhodobacteraceae bacterium]|nr:hypothetical protein [Paracoccaceae bacterium]